MQAETSTSKSQKTKPQNNKTDDHVKKAVTDYSKHLEDSRQVLEPKSKLKMETRGRPRKTDEKVPTSTDAPRPHSTETAVPFQSPTPSNLAPAIGHFVAVPFQMAAAQSQVPDVALNQEEQKVMGDNVDILRQLLFPQLGVDTRITAIAVSGFTVVSIVVGKYLILKNAKSQPNIKVPTQTAAPQNPMPETVQQNPDESKPLTPDFFAQNIADKEPT